MSENQVSLDWEFWRRWVLFSTLGYGIGGFVGWFIALFLGLFSMFGLLPFIALGGAIAGLSVGMAQWQAVRLKAPHANKWAWLAVNIVGLAISWVLFFWMLFTVPEVYAVFAFLVTGIFWGLLSATIQWFILQGQIRRPIIWFPLNSLCGILVFAVGLIWVPIVIFGYMSNSGSDILGFQFLSILFSIFSWPAAGMLTGLATGYLLTWLLSKPTQQDELNEHVLAE
jgi:hypothetical protein